MINSGHTSINNHTRDSQYLVNKLARWRKLLRIYALYFYFP